ncbi:hypothetical protein KY285_007331 [Solanum tuberosum]|nr:hypothetical protein KY285_007331 [Solanum tuberosum]
MCAFRTSSLLLEKSSLNHGNPSTTKLANKGIRKKTLGTLPVITYTTRILESRKKLKCYLSVTIASTLSVSDVASDTISSPPVQEVIVRIEPLQHEGVVPSN